MQMLSGLQRTNRFRNQVNTRYGTENFTVTYTSKSQCIELLNVATRRCLLTMARELMRGWPDEFIDFCQTYRLTSHILLKRLSPAPFWYWNVVHDHFTRTIYEYNDEEVRSALRCMEKMKEQLEGRRPFRYDEKMKAVSEFLIRERDSKYYNSNKWPNMQRKANWRNSGWTSKYEDRNIEPAPIHLIPDALWIKIKRLLPLSLYASGKDRNLSDNRKVVNGILYILCTDTPWHKTPAEFGSYTTIYRKYVRWKNSGALTQILALCSNIYS